MYKKIDDTDETMIDTEYIPNNLEHEEETTEMLIDGNKETITKPKFRPATINELNVSMIFNYSILL